MSLTSITKDFFVKSGLTVLGSSTVTTSTGNTQTLQVSGGAAIAKNLIVGSTTEVYGDTSLYSGLRVTNQTTLSNRVSVTDTTNSTSTISGALTVSGGVGIGQDLRVGGLIFGSLAANVSTASQLEVIERAVASTHYLTFVDSNNPTSAPENFYTSSTLYFNPDIGLTISNLTNSTSTVSGSLVLSGGAGIGQNLYVGGDINLSGTLTTVGTVNFTNTTGSTSSVSGALTVAGGVGIGENLRVSGTIYGNVIGDLTGIASTATNIAGGALGSIPYQTAAGTTAFIPIGTNGFVLKSNGTTATWVGLGELTVGNATTATNIQGGDQFQIPFQSGVGSTSFESGFEYWYTTDTLSATNVLIAGTTNSTSTQTGSLQVRGGAGIGQNLYVGGSTNITGLTTITNITNATSTNSGALVVNGGVGIGGNLIVSDLISTQNSLLTLKAGYSNTNTNLIKIGSGTSDNGSIDFIPYVVNGSNSNMGQINFWKDTLAPNDAYFNMWSHGSQAIYFYTTDTNYYSTFYHDYGSIGILGTVKGGAGVPNAVLNTDILAYVFDNNDANNSYTAMQVNGQERLRLALNLITLKTSSRIEGKLTVTNTTSATSTISGALVVAGGAGIGQNLYVGGTAIVTGSAIINDVTNSTSTTTGALVVSGGVGIGQNLHVGGGTQITGLTTVTNTTNSTSTVSGALTVAGGIGVGQNLYVGGNSNITGSVTITNTTNATSTTTGALTVTGGAGIGGDLFVSRVRTINTTNATTTQTGEIVVQGGIGVGQDIVVGGVIKTVAGVNATSTTSGDIQVAGGIGIGQSLYVGSTAASTTTVTANAVYIKGGLGVEESLFVKGPAVFQDDVVFAGTTTYIYSTQTVFTDNIINLHIPSAGDPNNHVWTVDDGKDIGHVYHYYQSGADKDAFLGLAKDSHYLEWYSNGTESGAVFTGTEYGIFKTGGIILTNTTASSNTTTGALTVVGGVGIGQDLRVGGTIYGPLVGNVTGTATTAVNLAGGTVGSIPYQTGDGQTAFIPIGINGQVLRSNGTTATWVVLADLSVGSAFTATNIQGGAQFQIPYQTAAGSTSFESGFEYWYTTDTLSATNVLVAGTTNATSTSTGALQIRGGVGIGQNLYIGGGAQVTGRFTTTNVLDALAIVNITTTSNATSTTTGALIVSGGVGIGQNLYVGGGTSITGLTTITNTTNSTSTQSGALTVVGGVGVGQNLHVGGVIKTTGAVNASNTTTGDLQVSGGAGIGQDLYVGGDLDINGGDITSSQTSFNFLNANVLTANILGAGTNITIGASGSGATTMRHSFTITDVTQSVSTNTGALQVRGGVGIAGNLVVAGINTVTNITNSTSTQSGALQVAGGVGIGQNLHVGGGVQVIGLTTVTNATASTSTNSGALTVVGGVGIGQALYIGGTLSVGGIVSFTDNTNATTTSDGSVRLTGGLSVVKDIVAGGLITAGATGAATPNSTVPAIFFNNTLLSSFTSNSISSTSTQNLDTFATGTYRSARYFSQISAGSSIHISEISIFHDGSKAYINEYGISTNNGVLGTFDATLSGGSVTMTFTPNTSTAMVVKMTRIALTA